MQAIVLALHEDLKNSQQVAESLRVLGYKVLLSKNFTQAIELLKNRHVDLIISDVHLENGGNVFDFLRWVKRNPNTQNTPFVFFSSAPTAAAKYFEDGIRTAARILGAAMYIGLESFDSEEFQTQIDSLLPANKRTTKSKITEDGEAK